MKRIDDYRLIIEKTGEMNVPVTIYSSKNMDIDEKAIIQITNATKLPSVDTVIGTPDIHTGFGVPIGCVLATENIVSPSAVGYDINCGMRLISTPFKKNDINPEELARSIQRDIPLGEGKHNVNVKNKYFLKVMENGLSAFPDAIKCEERLLNFFDEAEFEKDMLATEDNGQMEGIVSAVSEKAKGRGISQLGTLGGGNHFLEIQEITDVYDETTAESFGLSNGMITIMLHSGSRGFGHEIAGDYMKLALNKCTQNHLNIPSRDLSYLNAGSKEGRNFVGAMNAAANFAFVNRLLMTAFIRRNIRYHYGMDIKLPSVYDVPHNMVKNESHNNKQLWIHRKGATRAYSKSLMKGTYYENIGQPVIIPGSMGTSSYVLVGIDSGKESLYSVCHGAGRVLSRTSASGKRRHGKDVKEAAISDEDFKKSMEGVFLICDDKRTIKEEAPQAYKNIDDVIDVIIGAKLAKPVVRMKPLAVLKG